MIGNKLTLNNRSTDCKSTIKCDRMTLNDENKAQSAKTNSKFQM